MNKSLRIRCKVCDRGALSEETVHKYGSVISVIGSVMGVLTMIGIVLNIMVLIAGEVFIASIVFLVLGTFFILSLFMTEKKKHLKCGYCNSSTTAY